MKVTKKKDLAFTSRDVYGDGFRSMRYLLERDGMGFTVNRTEIPKGIIRVWHYKKHLEACLCIEGEGAVLDISSGNSWSIKPGDMYILDKHDRHQWRSIKDTVLISIFNPPLLGSEIHKEDGSYE